MTDDRHGPKPAVARQGLAVDPVLAQFVETELAPAAEIDADVLWRGLAELVVEFGPRNAQLLAERVRLQEAFDDWVATRSPAELADVAAQVEFLTSIGYLVPEPEGMSITTQGCDAEIGVTAGPQLVVPATNARYALNAANARWGSLYDALYGTDALGSPPPSGPYDVTRGNEVIAHVRDLLDRYLPLASGSHHDARRYFVQDGQLLVELSDGSASHLGDRTCFVGYSGRPAQPDAVVFRHHDLLVEICFDPSSPIGSNDAAGIRDVNLEAAVTAIVDLEDSVATVDADDKVVAYRTWLGLLEGNLQAPVPGRGMRRLESDRVIHAPDGSELVLPGRAVLLVRNVGLHMYTDSVRDADGAPIPEGILDALITITAARVDLGTGEGLRNSRTGSMYVVKPKLHGPDEVRHAVGILAAAERIADLPTGTVKIGIMDEERRTSANLAACIEAASDRVAFINTGFLDRTGDEIRTWMQAGPVLGKEAMRTAPWMLAYEDRNVDLGLAAQFPGRAQIGKGMWAAPDRMADMLDRKVGHPQAGATCAWVPSPTAATLHALHYHAVDVHNRQQELRAAGPRRRREDLLVPPLAAALDDAIVQEELDNAAQGILGYVVRWVMQGVGCSKVPDIHDIGLMEDRATLRISSQLLANWRHHGVLTDARIDEAFQRMSLIVDAQNADDPLYTPIAGSMEAPAMIAALRLVREGADEPGGYTERVLTEVRRDVKSHV